MDRKIVVACLCLIIAGLFGLFVGVASQPEFASDKRILLQPFFSVCTAVITSSIMILVFDLYVRRENQQRKDASMIEQISTSVKETIMVGSIGVRGIHDGVQDQMLIKEAQASSFFQILNTYPPNIQTLRPAIETVFENDGYIQVAIASDDSPFVDLRMNGLHRNRSEFEGALQTTISRLISMWDSKGRKGKLEIREYSGSPGICYYATGNISFVGTFLEGLDAINSPQIELDKRSWAYTRYSDHFQKIWQSSSEVEIPL